MEPQSPVVAPPPQLAAGIATYFALTRGMVKSSHAFGLCGLVGMLGLVFLFAGSGRGAAAGASFFVVTAAVAGASASWMWIKFEARLSELDLE